jgi:hypothetical protein
MESVKYIESDKNNGLCYQFEKLEFKNALLDIDATYVVHLDNNGRLDSVKAQLNEFRPTKDVFILHNKGYRTCEKEEYIKTPPLDLVDAFLYIFKDAQQKNYKHILVLEDDFIFSNRIKDKKVQQNIMNFISNKNYDVYGLGTLPIMQKVYDNSTNINIIGIGTHAMIYSRECINKTLQKDRKSIKDWDYFTGTTFTRYMYNEPLCYQLFPETENQKHWDRNIFILTLLHIIKLLKLDVQVEPGYNTMYIMSKGLYGLCVILVVWLFITVFKV